MAERFGDEADPDRLLFDWSLSEADLQEIRRARGGDNRLWTALHLCNLRRTGRFVDDVEQVPHDAVIHLVRQLGAAFPVRLAPLARQPTDSAIRARVRVHLGFVPFSVDSQDRLEADLSGVAADGSAAADLVQRAEALLCAAKVVVPARPTLERLVASIVRQVLERLYNSIAARLPPPMCEALDRLVGQLAGEAEAGTHGRASLGRYRTPSAASMGRFTREARQRLEEIGGMLTDLPDLGDVSPPAVCPVVPTLRRSRPAALSTRQALQPVGVFSGRSASGIA